MPSSRRPTYTSPRRGSSRWTGEEDSPTTAKPTTAQPTTAGPAGDGDVISASRSAPEPAADEAAHRPAAHGATAQQGGTRRAGTPGFPGVRRAKSREDGGAAGGNVLVFPEPPARRRRRTLLVVAAVVAVLVAGLLVAAIYSPVLAVTGFSVSGTKLLTPAQVTSALEPLRGKPLPQISDDEVARLLQPLVQIKSVSVEARPPSGLAVDVRERVPVALVKQGDQYQLVDVDGVQLASTDDPASVQLPVIDGGAGAIGKDLFHATAEVLAALPAEVLAKLSNASAQSVDAVELKLVDGQTIVWGNAGEKELKAKVLAALLKAPVDPKNPVHVYDVSAPRHPVTR